MRSADSRSSCSASQLHSVILGGPGGLQGPQVLKSNPVGEIWDVCNILEGWNFNIKSKYMALLAPQRSSKLKSINISITQNNLFTRLKLHKCNCYLICLLLRIRARRLRREEGFNLCVFPNMCRLYERWVHIFQQFNSQSVLHRDKCRQSAKRG